MARPRKINKEILAKLEQAFKIGANDEEACLHAGIDPATLYRYQDKNEAFCKQKVMWKRNPILKARHTIYKNLDDPSVAKWLLERRDKDYSTKIEQEVKTNQPSITLKIERAEIKEAVQDIDELADE